MSPKTWQDSEVKHVTAWVLLASDLEHPPHADRAILVRPQLLHYLATGDHRAVSILLGRKADFNTARGVLVLKAARAHVCIARLEMLGLSSQSLKPAEPAKEPQRREPQRRSTGLG